MMNASNAVVKNKDPIKVLLDKHREKDMFYRFASMRYVHWRNFQVVLLFFYLIVVAQAGEIVVKCRTISDTFTNPKSAAFFMFFEFEVMAFIGLILGINKISLIDYSIQNICCKMAFELYH